MPDKKITTWRTWKNRCGDRGLGYDLKTWVCKNLKNTMVFQPNGLYEYKRCTPTNCSTWRRLKEPILILTKDDLYPKGRFSYADIDRIEECRLKEPKQ
jgi:hypothetical protein